HRQRVLAGQKPLISNRPADRHRQVRADRGRGRATRWPVAQSRAGARGDGVVVQEVRARRSRARGSSAERRRNLLQVVSILVHVKKRRQIIRPIGRKKLRPAGRILKWLGGRRLELLKGP